MLQGILDRYQRRRYNKPPIKEVLCEMHLKNSDKWHLTNFGVLKQEFHKNYPNTFEIPGLTFEIGQNLTDKDKGLLHASQQIQQRVQYRDSDGVYLIQAFPDLLTVNQIPTEEFPYSDWESFLERVINAQDIVCKAIPTLQGIRFFVIRFIDEFFLEIHEDTKLRDILNGTSTLIPSEIADSPVYLGGQIFLEIPALPFASVYRMHLDWTNISSSIKVVLDTSVGLELTPPCWISDFRDRIAKAKSLISSCFEDLLSDDLRIKFGELREEKLQ